MFWGRLILLFIIYILARLYDRLLKRKFRKLFERYKTSASAVPFIGHGLLFLFADHEEHTKMLIDFGKESYQHGGMVAGWLCYKLYLGVANVEVAEEILKTCTKKDDCMNLLHLLTGHGSLFAPVHIWRHRRKMISPTFRMTNLMQYLKIFDKQSMVMNKCLSEVGAETFSISDYFTRYSLDAVCESTFGVTIQSQLNPRHEFAVALRGAFELVIERVLRPWMYNDTIYKLLPHYKKIACYKDTINNFVSEVVNTTRQSVHQNNEVIGLKSFLTLLMQSAQNTGEGFNDKELSEEALVLILAGTDTSAVGASFTALLLSRHPRVQDKCYQELLEVFGESDRAVTHSDLLRLKYLEAVIKETMRLYPPAPIVTRQAETDIHLPSTGDVVPKGCGIVISIYSIHRNPLYWGADADQFRPERFLDEGIKHPAAFMPFILGPRSCLGYKYAMLSMTTVLANVLRRYQLLAALPRCEHAHIRLKNDIMLRDVDNFPVRIQARHN